MQVTNATGTNTPQYHHRCWLLNFALITIRMVLFLFSLEDTTSMISKNLKCGHVRPQHAFPLCISPSHMSLGPENPATFLDVVDIGLVVISSTEWCRFLMQCCLRDWRSQAFNVGFQPCYLRAEISPDSLNLLMMLLTVDDEITKFLAIVCWEMLFLNCKTICSRCCSQSGEPPPSLLENNCAFRGCSFYTQSWHSAVSN